ncbi:MAG TPA: protein phosphatase 2C domain-containing protein [Planctomycetota bacterium]|nr:protein phosphatase 2C domain-containing protein [Planctomycetota bacterium]
MQKSRKFREGWGQVDLREDFAHRVDCHGVSLIGSKRTVNQDEYLITSLSAPGEPRSSAQERGGVRSGPPLLLVVADGIGGAPAGERASVLAVRALRDTLMSRFAAAPFQDPEGTDPGTLLKEAVIEGQKAIDDEIERDSERDGMGTTLTAALILWPKAHLVHVGDSRCYLVRHSSVEQLTVDHTIVQRLPDAHPDLEMPEPPSRWRHILWNVIGGRSSELHPQVRTIDLQWGDALLLATDGLTGSLSDQEILHRVQAERSAEAVCTRLIQTAQARKGTDDMTVLCARFGRSSLWKHLREIFLGG